MTDAELGQAVRKLFDAIDEQKRYEQIFRQHHGYLFDDRDKWVAARDRYCSAADAAVGAAYRALDSNRLL
jgi:uncharacterized protein YecT (DUF1311 family)